MNTEHYIRGMILGALGTVEACGAWFLNHIQAINGVMEFLIYAVALATTVIGLHKALKKR